MKAHPPVPVVPVFSLGPLLGPPLSGRGRTELPSVYDLPYRIDTSSGSAAIALALTAAGVDAGDEVLVPAYHCLSMVEPVRAVSAVPVYYRLHPNLSLNLQDLAARITPRTRAVLVTHYFGFPQPLSPVRTLCDRSGAVLIEDCAHAFFGLFEGKGVGSAGDYAVASARKFFPTHDGGCLASARHAFDAVEPSPADLLFELKAAINILEDAFAHGRARVAFAALRLPLRLKDRLWKRMKRASSKLADTGIDPAPSAGFRYLAAESMRRRMSIASRAVVAAWPRARIVERRRRFYRRLADGLSDAVGGAALRPELPDGVVPYMFPFVVEQPDAAFPALKARGVPIYRWEELATDVCTVSNAYSRRLLQLPCHSELRETEIDWIVACVRETLADVHRRAPSAGSSIGATPEIPRKQAP